MARRKTTQWVDHSPSWMLLWLNGTGVQLIPTFRFTAPCLAMISLQPLNQWEPHLDRLAWKEVSRLPPHQPTPNLALEITLGGRTSHKMKVKYFCTIREQSSHVSTKKVFIFCTNGNINLSLGRPVTNPMSHKNQRKYATQARCLGSLAVLDRISMEEQTLINCKRTIPQLICQPIVAWIFRGPSLCHFKYFHGNSWIWIEGKTFYVSFRLPWGQGGIEMEMLRGHVLFCFLKKDSGMPLGHGKQDLWMRPEFHWTCLQHCLLKLILFTLLVIKSGCCEAYTAALFFAVFLKWTQRWWL